MLSKFFVYYIKELEMKKLAYLVIVIILTSCKTSSHKCDAYGSVEEYDINKATLESQKKYSSYIVIK